MLLISPTDRNGQETLVYHPMIQYDLIRKEMQLIVDRADRQHLRRADRPTRRWRRWTRR